MNESDPRRFFAVAGVSVVSNEKAAFKYIAGAHRRARIGRVSSVGRNQPCPCGSGRKAKLCCGVRRGPSEAELAKAFLAVQARWAAPRLVHFDEGELQVLWDEMLDLPHKDLSLLMPLPELLTPDMERLCEAFSDDEPDTAEAILPGVVKTYDSPVVRVRFAKSIIAIRDRGEIAPELAAIALMDLALDSTAFLAAALVASIAVQVGITATPAGLVLATS
jgi:hypothetical protein